MKYMIKKIITLIITLLLVSMVTFVAFSVIPGDAATTKLATYATEERVEALRSVMQRGLKMLCMEILENLISMKVFR